MDLSVDSRLEMVETWATRKDSYWASAEDMESKDRGESKPGARGGESVSDPRGTMRGIRSLASPSPTVPCKTPRDCGPGNPATHPYRV